LPGLPNERVQRSLDAGIRADRDGHRRGFVVLEWMVGETLEDLLRRGELTGSAARSVLAQLLGDIVIPLWSAGTVWWDFRDANLCFDTATGRVRLIDVDSLAAYADEILRAPGVWEKRDRGRVTALARLRRTAVRLVQAGAAGARKKIETAVTGAWQEELEGPLVVLGKAADSRLQGAAALERFLARLESQGLLPRADTRTDTIVEG
ncbi:MAG: hypothetical protein K2V38_13860, partial [Gemmataceae bacterium]|nr:hypothetical protein [Gemmataceae bacterium]